MELFIQVIVVPLIVIPIAGMLALILFKLDLPRPLAYIITIMFTFFSSLFLFTEIL